MTPVDETSERWLVICDAAGFFSRLRRLLPVFSQAEKSSSIKSALKNGGLSQSNHARK